MTLVTVSATALAARGAAARGAQAAGVAGARAQAASVHGPSTAVPGALTATAASTTPTPKQIRQALAKAKRSIRLWATINICDVPGPKAGTKALGIRGQMPALGFRTSFVMKFIVRYWDNMKHKFLLDPKAKGTAKPHGTFKTGTIQDGYTFYFNPPLFLAGQVTFEWVLGGKVIGKATKNTTFGHHNAHGIPKHFSSANCHIR